MKPSYWPEEYDCRHTSAIEHSSTEHIHCRTDADVVAEYFALRSNSQANWDAGRRYFCITGPNGRRLRSVL